MSAPTTRQRLLSAAYELFSRDGFHAVGLDRILADAGVSKQTFYNHFESRDDLIVELLKLQDQMELAELERNVCSRAGEDPRQRLRTVFEYLDEWMNSPDFRGCLFMTASIEFPSQHDPAHQAAGDHMRTLQRCLRSWATQAGAEDPDSLAEQLLLLMQGAVLMRQSMGRCDASLIALKMADTLLDQRLPLEQSTAR